METFKRQLMQSLSDDNSSVRSLHLFFFQVYFIISVVYYEILVSLSALIFSVSVVQYLKKPILVNLISNPVLIAG